MYGLITKPRHQCGSCCYGLIAAQMPETSHCPSIHRLTVMSSHHLCSPHSASFYPPAMLMALMWNAGSLPLEAPAPKVKTAKHLHKAPVHALAASCSPYPRSKTTEFKHKCRLDIGSDGYLLMHRISHLARKGYVLIAQGRKAAPSGPTTTTQQPPGTLSGIWALTPHQFEDSEKPSLMLSEVQTAHLTLR